MDALPELKQRWWLSLPELIAVALPIWQSQLQNGWFELVAKLTLTHWLQEAAEGTDMFYLENRQLASLA